MLRVLGLMNLNELSLDNTTITDEGVRHIAKLRNLAYLSLSDTRYMPLVLLYKFIKILCSFILYRVTSKFIIEGTLSRLNNLNKLNLSRTSVDDEGIMYAFLYIIVSYNYFCSST